MRPESPSGLYWSMRGKVLCAEHTSEIDDDRWAAENWEPLPSPHDRASISANGAPPIAQPSPTPLPVGHPHEGLTNASLCSFW